ncbi:hypothetical protein C8R45DRAFT_1179061 [Mycena sanguinolenta]|nr:hypothetical protein C8R45DRAFT_1179061 [Mycena sanguinolenta]
MDSGDAIVIRDQRVIGYFTVASVVVLVYDHLLTFDEEIANVWQPLQHRTWRLASTAWFLFIRALFIRLFSCTLMNGSFIEDVSVVRSSVDTDDESKSAASCSLLGIIRGICIIALEFIIGLSLFFRVYAMYSCDKRILAVLIVVAIAAASIAIVTLPPGVTGTISTPVPSIEYRGPGCYTPLARAQLLRVVAAWDAELGCEILVIVLTVYRAIQQNRFTFNSPSRLWRVMLRDGLAYFFTVSLANVVNILYFGDTTTSNSFTWPATMYACSASSLLSKLHHSHPMLMGIHRIAVAMITRLMLNLRATLRIQDMDEGQATRAEPLRFRVPPEENFGERFLLPSPPPLAFLRLPSHLSFLSPPPPLRALKLKPQQRPQPARSPPRSRANTQPGARSRPSRRCVRAGSILVRPARSVSGSSLASVMKAM